MVDQRGCLIESSKIPPFQKKREGGKIEQNSGKEKCFNGEASELLRSEHTISTLKKALGVTVREGYVRKQQKSGIEAVFRRVAEKGGLMDR